MTTLDTEIEMTRALHAFAQTYRRQKRKPEMAPVAAAREIQFKGELDELERRKAAATQQPELLPPAAAVGELSAEEVVRRGKAALAEKAA